MTQEDGVRGRRGVNMSLLLLLGLLLLVCACLVSPALARLGGPFGALDPIGRFTKPIVCRVPQLAAIALFCPAGEQDAFCGQTCDPNNKETCGAFANVSCQKNADGRFVCGGAGCQPTTTGGACNTPCDPKSPKCDPGLSCVQEPDGGTVCWGGKDSTGEVCGGGTPTAGQCNAPCQPASTASQCDPGLKCVQEPDGGFVCWGGKDSSGQTCGPRTGGGTRTCWQSCDPKGNDCAAGLTCAIYGSPTSNMYACESPNCPPLTGGTEPSTQQAGCACRGVDLICADGKNSYNSTECGGSGQCGCRDPNKTLACPDGTYATFNPQCGVGGGQSGKCTCVQNTACGQYAAGCPPYVCAEDGKTACQP